MTALRVMRFALVASFFFMLPGNREVEGGLPTVRIEPGIWANASNGISSLFIAGYVLLDNLTHITVTTSRDIEYLLDQTVQAATMLVSNLIQTVEQTLLDLVGILGLTPFVGDYVTDFIRHINNCTHRVNPLVIVDAGHNITMCLVRPVNQTINGLARLIHHINLLGGYMAVSFNKIYGAPSIGDKLNEIIQLPLTELKQIPRILGAIIDVLIDIVTGIFKIIGCGLFTLIFKLVGQLIDNGGYVVGCIFT